MYVPTLWWVPPVVLQRMVSCLPTVGSMAIVIQTTHHGSGCSCMVSTRLLVATADVI